MNEHIINLVLGDWSLDGHEKTATRTIISNFTREELSEAYARGVDIVGIDLMKSVCCDYGDSMISESVWERFTQLGFEPGSDLFEDFTIDTDTFTDLWIFTAKLGSSDLIVRVLEGDKLPIGGYGIFDL